MKTTLKILLRFCMATGAALLLLVLIHSMVRSGQAGLNPSEGGGELVDLVLRSLYLSLLPAWIFGALYALFSSLHNLQKSVLPLGFVWVAAGGALFGLLLLQGMLFRVSSTDDEFVLQPHPGTVYRYSERAMVMGGVDGVRLEQLLLYEPEGILPHWQYIPEAVMDPSQGEIILPGRDDFDLENSRTARWALFSLPAELAGLTAEVRELQVITSQQGLLWLAATALAVSAMFFAVWTLVRLTRWPLLNALLVLAAVRGQLWGGAAAVQPEMRELTGVVFGKSPAIVPLLIFCTLAALVLLVTGLLLPPFRQWAREIGHE